MEDHLSESSCSRKPHAICFPAPAQSHIGAMLKLAKLLHHKGFYITFVNTEFNHARLLKARAGDPNSAVEGDLLSGNRFRFLTIPDGLPPSNADATQDSVSITKSARHHMVAPFSDLVSNHLRHASDTLKATGTASFPPISCIVADGFMSFTTCPAAEKFEIPLINLWTIPACALMGLMQFRALMDKGLVPLPDESYLSNGYLDTPIDWIPGMKNMRLRDMPGCCRITDPDDTFFNYILGVADRAQKATATAIHTFEALEPHVLSALSSLVPRLYAVGPLNLLLNQIPGSDQPSVVKNIGGNLWKEHSECIQWLDSKRPGSVIYVSFGSVACLTHQQLVEFAVGLARSEQCFLWVIRPDLVMDASGIDLPGEFLEEITRERGLLSGWCPQEKVLNHPAVGGFLTHCGWSSTIESLSAGVPMLCWPRQVDQQTICKYACDEWGVGLEIGSDVKREEVGKLVRELMTEGEKGKKMKKRAMEWKELAAQAVGPHGSSSISLDMLINDILSK
ncbi:7-deoxyloganetin glucosyltransferase-like [Rhodamnia argentea]|uniref:Glycosyltransferase n=1 Tax=Rhodamnia argentea TaxID=178133 RepID=A0ABM3HTM9_9MYRT|nr:7-deoxyloganetin glucosyltransferase-like [Rhodamnia argentea]